jgi:hypothetical protein
MAIIGRFPGVLSRHSVSWPTASLRSLLLRGEKKRKERISASARSREAAVTAPAWRFGLTASLRSLLIEASFSLFEGR